MFCRSKTEFFLYVICTRVCCMKVESDGESGKDGE